LDQAPSRQRSRITDGSRATEVVAKPTTNGHSVAVAEGRNRPPSEQEDPAARARKQRSRITNGSAFVLGTDQRNPWIRRCKDISAAHLSDLGGDDNVSEAQRSLVRRIGVLTTQLERLERRFAQANGQATASDLDLYVRASGNLRRILQTIGLERRAKPVPTMQEFLRSLPPQEDARVDEAELADND